MTKPLWRATESLRIKVTLRCSAIIALVVLIFCSSVFLFVWQDSLNHANQSLKMTKARFETELEKAFHRGDPQHILKYHRSEDWLEKTQIIIVNPTGQRSNDDTPPVSAAGQMTERIASGQQFIWIIYDWKSQSRELRMFGLRLLAGGLAVVFLAAIGAWFGVGWTLRPIEQLVLQLDTASTERLDVRLTPTSNDAEIVHLVQTINKLLSRLTDSAAAKSRIYASSSHELRTPLQAMCGHLELALNKDRTKDEYRDAIGEALAQTRKLMSVVQDILMLHRLEATDAPESEPLNLTDYIRKCADLFALPIKNENYQLDLRVPEELVVNAPESHLSMLVRNLIENAVRYGKPGGKLVITASDMEDSAAFYVYNESDDIGEEEASRLFEPFYRLDTHGPASDVKGNGLGLTICRAICIANRWDIALTPQIGGLGALVRFPK